MYVVKGIESLKRYIFFFHFAKLTYQGHKNRIFSTRDKRHLAVDFGFCFKVGFTARKNT